MPKYETSILVKMWIWHRPRVALFSVPILKHKIRNLFQFTSPDDKLEQYVGTNEVPTYF